MDIRDYMGGLGDVPALSPEAWTDILVLRHETHRGFMDNEKANRGILVSPFDLSTPQGQDSARLLFWRCIEEYSEAIEAQDPQHRLEELIDSFNYISSALTESGIPVDVSLLPDSVSFGIYGKSESRRLGYIAHMLAQVTDKFRNRAWMENAQSTYWDGSKEYTTALIGVIRLLCNEFGSWTEFWQYFMAKDAVLQFRLRSKY